MASEKASQPTIEELVLTQKLLLHRRAILLGRIANRRGSATLNYFRLQDIQDNLLSLDKEITAIGYDPVTHRHQADSSPTPGHPTDVASDPDA